LLARSAQRMHRVETGAHQIAHRLMLGIRNPHRRQLTRPMQPRQTGRIPPIGLNPAPARFGISDGATTTHSCPSADN
jgi:hypothetical protein